MGTRKCCVGGCDATSETNRLFCFPKNDVLRNLWMSFVAPTNSLLIDFSKQELLRRRVCEKHFEKDQFDSDGGRLSYAYPCLLSKKEIVHGVPLREAGWAVTLEHNYGKEPGDETDIEPSQIKIEIGEGASCHNDYELHDLYNTTKSSRMIPSAGVILEKLSSSCRGSMTKEEQKTLRFYIKNKIRSRLKALASRKKKLNLITDIKKECINDLFIQIYKH